MEIKEAPIPYFQNVKFVRVCYLVGRYFCNVYKSFSALTIRMRLSTSNTKQSSFLYKKIMKIPTQKGEHSCKCTELSLKWKEGINDVGQWAKIKKRSKCLWIKKQIGPFCIHSLEIYSIESPMPGHDFLDCFSDDRNYFWNWFCQITCQGVNLKIEGFVSNQFPYFSKILRKKEMQYFSTV